MVNKLAEGNDGESAKNSLILVSSDDEEGSKDLSHRIVEKAKDSRGGGSGGNGARLDEGVIDLSSSSCEEVEGFVGRSRGGVVLEQRRKKRKTRKKKKKKSMQIENVEQNKSAGVTNSEEPSGTVTSVERETVVEMQKPGEAVEVIELEKLAGTVEAGETEPVGVVDMQQLDDTVKATETENPYLHGSEVPEPVSIVDVEQLGDADKVMEAEDLVDTVEVVETSKNEDVDAVEITDNIVLKKLLRGARYFDPPDRNSRTCYYCDEEGHNAANCTSKRRKKPCFICGSFEHVVRNCSQGQYCFKCKKQGHRPKDCTEKHQTNSIDSKICLRCGDVGHLMFSCSRDYDPEDLKEIQCYVCKMPGHLCCVEPITLGPGEVSCYNCGKSGHIGAGCAKYGGNVSSADQAIKCYRCGGKGHFVRNCTKVSKPRPKDDSSTPRKDPGKGKELLGVQSAPPRFTQNHLNRKSKENGLESPVTPIKSIPKILVENTGENPSNSQSPGPSKLHTDKQTQSEERDFTTKERLKRKWGNIDTTQNSVNRKSKANVWKNPVTPVQSTPKIPVQKTQSHPSNSQSSWTPSHLNPRTPTPRGSSYPVHPITPTYASPNVNRITPNSYGSSYSGYPVPPNSLGSVYPPNPTSHVPAYPNIQPSHGSPYPRIPPNGFANSYHRMYTDPRYDSPIGSGGRRNFW